MPPISLPPPRCCICKKPIEKGPYTEQGRWFIVAHPACARKKHGYGPEQSDGSIPTEGAE
jgi:hypothetical protein